MTAPRGRDIPPFYASLISRQAAALARAGRTVIPMHFGQPTAGAPPKALAAAHQMLDGHIPGYWESTPLALRIVRHYAETYGVAITQGQVLITSGASAALVAIFSALFDHGDRIGFARPGYAAYRNALLGLGRTVVEIEGDPADGLRLSAAALARLETPLHGLIVASPNNPTGTMLSRERLAAIAAECRRQGTRLISDEIYHGITYTERAVCALEVDPGAIVVNSFSKLYRMPGWRLGWMVVPEALHERLSSYVVNLFLTAPSLSQHAALQAFDELPELQKSVESYARNRSALRSALASMGITNVAPPDGAFYLYADIGHLTGDSLGFCQRLLEDTGVAAAPGIDFDPIDGQRWIRFSFAVSEPEVAQAIALLGPWLAKQPRLTG
jgi:aspartate/methionine/tyrosine aminotransferase